MKPWKKNEVLFKEFFQQTIHFREHPHLPAILKVRNHSSKNRFIKPQAPRLIKSIRVFPEKPTLKLFMWKMPRQVCQHPTLKAIRLTNKSYIRFTVGAEKILGLIDFTITGNTFLRKNKTQNASKPTQNTSYNYSKLNTHNLSLWAQINLHFL